MNDPRHWPYANEYVRNSLDPKLIEQHASEIVSRSLIYRRMIAFVGSGVTLAYGRLNWDELVTHVVTHVSQAARKHGPKDDDALLRLIQAEAALAKAGNTKSRKVQDKTSLMLLCRQVYERYLPDAPSSFGKLVADAVKNIGQHADNIRRDRPDARIRKLLESQPGLDRDSIRTLDEARHRYIQILAGEKDDKSRVNAPRVAARLRAHSAPIYTLISRLGINRLLTTNYDTEIEDTLQELLQGDTASGFDKTVFDPGASAKALRFAIDGRRPRTTVLHLHGVHDAPGNLVVTETDYQRLYLRDGERRDLIDNSMHALFAASPLLFIGTDLTEDDILRPLRLFMSSYNPRSDRVAVALLPATKPLDDLMLDKIKLLTRYGVHAIHYDLHGRPIDGSSPSYLVVDGKNRTTHTWLSAYNSMRDALKDGKLDQATRQWKKLKRDATKPPAGCPGLAPDIAMVDHVFALVGDKPAMARSAYVARVLKEALNSVISFAVCEALLTLDRQRQAWHEQRFNPARAYQPNPRRRYLKTPYHRLTLAPDHHRLADADLHRFGVARHADDERIDRLLFDLESNAPFCAWPGRRTLLIASQRGVGKGSLFDSLAATSAPDGRATALARLKDTLHIPQSATTGTLALNSTTDLLNLSDIIGRLIGAHAFEGKLADDDEIDSTRLPPRSNVFGRLEYALDRLADIGPELIGHRVLIVMAHIGMLFDETGTPKNGLVARFIKLLSHEKYQHIPLDMVLFTDENQVPKQFRQYLHPDQPARRLVDPLGTHPQLGYQEWREHEAAIRLDRLQLGTLRQNERVHLHVPRREWASSIARRHFPVLWRSLAAGRDDAQTEAHHQEWFKAINRLTGGSRICLTMLFALGEETCLLGCHTPERLPDDPAPGLAAFQADVRSALTAHPLESAPDSTLNYIFDCWQRLHVESLGLAGHLDLRVARILGTFMDEGDKPVAQAPAHFWHFCQELLWHLAVVSHPVDLFFLTRCPGVRASAAAFLQANQPANKRTALDPGVLCHLVEAALESCVFRCLVFRQTSGVHEQPKLYRYSVHRLVQRYFFRRMGGKNVEPTDWDQFSTTLYSSQPDDSPTFTTAAHTKLTQLIRSLAHYPPATTHDDTLPEGTPASLRQAYFVLRATYSVGALSRISRFGDGSHGPPDHGFLEDYRRLVRWITLQAMKTGPDGRPVKAGEPPAAIFHPGELVWLYNECGVVNLAQGKLEDADSVLSLAEAAAGMVEADPTGSLHVRVRLNAALVMIERGRPLRARSMLVPIAQRVGGNTTSPQIARHYLGLLEHLAGNYAEAERQYKAAEEGMVSDKRWRALALLKKDMADLHLVRHPHETEQALAIVNEAMDLAQRGGHEDVRVMCALTRASIHVHSKSTADHAKVYGALLDAERHAHELDMPRVLCEAREIRACMLLQQGETRLSASEASRSLEIAALYDMKLRKARGLLTLARIYHARADDDGALALVETGSEIAASAEYYACVKGFRELQVQIDPSGRRVGSPAMKPDV